MAVLEIKDLHVSIEGKEILKGVNLKTGPGEVHAIMGPNGSGKSTLAYTLLAHPKYVVTKGDILIDGESILGLSADERAKKGLFLGFQYPTEVSGVGFSHFLRTAYNSLSKALEGDNREVFITVREFQKYLKENLKLRNCQIASLLNRDNRTIWDSYSSSRKKMEHDFLVEKHVEAGVCVDLLPSYMGYEICFHAIYPQRKLMSRKVQLLLDFLQRELANT